MGVVNKSPTIWLRCVAASSMLLAVCGSIVVRYFYEDAPYTLTLALWPVFILSLEPGYQVASMKGNTLKNKEN